MQKIEILKDWVVQLNPDTVRNKMFGGCFMTVTEPKPWGAQGFVQALGENGEIGGQAFYRANWDEMELAGQAVFVIGKKEDNEENQEATA